MKIFEVTSKHLNFHSLIIRPTEQRFPERVKAYQVYFIKMNVKNNQKEDEIENTEDMRWYRID